MTKVNVKFIVTPVISLLYFLSKLLLAMQKTTTILFAMFVVANTATAEGFNNNELTTVSATPGDVFPHFGNNFSGGKGVTEPKSRLVGKTYFLFNNGNFIPKDSAVYIYGGNHGGSPDIAEPNKDEHILFAHSYVYDYVGLQDKYEPRTHRIQEFNSDDRVSKLIYQNWDYGDQQWENYTRYTYYYNTTGKMTTSLLQIWTGGLWTQDMPSVLSYDNNNRVSDMSSLTYQIKFGYEANTKNLNLVEDKTYNISTGQWENNERKEYDYDNNNNVIEFILKEWNSSNNSWVEMERWLYTYDNNNNIIESEQMLWNGSWVNDKKYKYQYSGVNETSKTEYVWNSAQNKYVESRKTTRTYNTYNQPETYITYTWNGNAWSHTNNDEQIHYYYEYYDPTGIGNIADVTIDMNLYPVPASNSVNVSMKKEHSGDINISIVNMSGSIVYSNTQATYGDVNTSIDVSNLPAGNYMLHVSGEQVDAVERLVVMH